MQTVRIPSMMKIQLQPMCQFGKPGSALRCPRNLPPSSKARQTVHLHQTKCQDTTERRRNYPKEIEDRVPLAHVVTDIPGREEVDAALWMSSVSGPSPVMHVATHREETGLHQPQDDTTCGESLPSVREAHANHHGTPGDTQASEEVARSNLAGQDRGWRLEDDVCGEEDECDDGLSCNITSASS